MKKAAGTLCAALILATSGVYAQTQSSSSGMITGTSSTQSHSQTDKNDNSGDLQVKSAVPSDAMLDLRTAVRALREASVKLVEPGVSKQPGPERSKAFQAAQDAIFKVQRAMIQLPDAYHGGEIHEAKDWPVVAGRIEKASIVIEKAVDELQDKGKPNSQAVKTLQSALNDAEKALRSMPEWRIGDKS